MNYLHGLVLQMEASDFSNSSDTRLAVSRIITWTTEPKSVEVRKAAQAVLIALFNLNTPEFSMMLHVLPKTFQVRGYCVLSLAFNAHSFWGVVFQDGATKILNNHLRTASQESEPLSPRNVTSPNTLSSRKYRPSPAR